MLLRVYCVNKANQFQLEIRRKTIRQALHMLLSGVLTLSGGFYGKLCDPSIILIRELSPNLEN